MRTRRLTDLIRFSADGPRREVLHEGERVWAQVICLQDAQMLGPLSDPASEGMVTVIAGEVAVQVGRGRARMKQWEVARIDPGAELTVRNASPEPAVVLLVLSPPPGS